MRNLVLLAYFFIYFVWGANFVSTYYAIQYLPPFSMIGCRFATAGLILFGIGLFRERRLPRWEAVRPAIVQGFFLNVLGTTPLVWGQQYVPSGLASILVTTVPLWTVLMDRDNRQSNLRNPWVLIGLLLGMLGVLLLARDGVFRPGNVALHDYVAGLIVIISGTFFWAYGAIFVKKRKQSGGLFMNVAIQLFFAGSVQLVIGAVMGEWPLIHFGAIEWQGILALLHLILLSSVIGYVCYIWLLQHRSATEVGTHTFVNPVIAVSLGVILAGEPFTLSLVASLALVLVAVFLVRYHRLLGRNIKMIGRIRK
ncbi:MAG: EamA family transporter [Saprospiraceae bacterium]|nr:EamA family transporter [Lewinella sp.]